MIKFPFIYIVEAACSSDEERNVYALSGRHTLYYKKSCPYCQKVLRFMQDNKINLDMRDTLQLNKREHPKVCVNLQTDVR